MNRVVTTVRTCSVLLPLLAASAAHAQTAHMIADLNLRRDATIGRILDANGLAIVRAFVPDTGWALWRTTGTGTSVISSDPLLASQAQAFDGFSMSYAFDGKVYVDIPVVPSNRNLIEINPLDSATRVVSSVSVGSLHRSSRHLVLSMPFSGVYEMVVARAGTNLDFVRVTGLPPAIYLAAYDFCSVGDQWLLCWAHDGTTNRTWRINAITGQATEVPVPGPIQYEFELNGKMVAVSVPRASDGSATQTIVWVDPATGQVESLPYPSNLYTSGSEPLRPVPCGDRFYFPAEEQNQSPRVPRLYWVDTIARTFGFVSTPIRPTNNLPTIAIGTDFYFISSSTTNGIEVFRKRADNAVPELVADINPNGNAFKNPLQYQATNSWGVKLGERLVVLADDGTHGVEPWIIDPAQGTRALLDILPGSASSTPEFKGVSGGRAYFTADDGIHGIELWSTDGTAGGTSLVRDFETRTNGSGPSGFAHAFGDVYFSASPTPGNTKVYEAPLAGGQPEVLMNGSVAFVTQVGSKAFMKASSSPSNLLVRDADGAWQTVPILPPVGDYCFSGSPWGSEVATPNSSGGLLVIANGQLWTTDGTATGTYKLTEASPCEWAMIRGTFYFTANDGVFGSELWQSDGTIAGTRIVMDLAPGSASSSPRGLVISGETLYFAARDAGGVERLWWVSPRSPVPMSTPCNIAGLAIEDVRPFGVSRGKILVGSRYPFWSQAPIYACNPLNGSITGPVHVPNCSSSFTQGKPPMQPTGDTFLVFGYAEETGVEPYSFDPISGAWSVLADTYPGARGEANDLLVSARGIHFFAANEPELGNTLWRSDGTPGGTRRVADIAPPAVVYGYDAAVVGQRLFLAGDDGQHGLEPWRIDFCGADYDYDGGVTIDDLIAFLTDFESGKDWADLIGADGEYPDGAVTIDDLLYFVSHFADGC